MRTMIRPALAAAALTFAGAIPGNPLAPLMGEPAPGAAQAQQSQLAQAKAQGQVGEKPDGLVGAVSSNPSPAIQRLVDTINQQRLAEYRRIAADTNTPLSAVQARAGRQLIASLPKGQYFQDAAGRWRKK
ncbi:hypothetical protein EV659_10548 [Rhodothalassium salexigens DSM 2132]|uniref:DUF1318 domain-containing protein n=1 Tax=Rhodothalassium salexigens DSM 2132 TaxID=1188247 RepID=A0A4R2PGD6_RHOSA|nr:YdbL family protein [Rhodothalassium salexigens]MBB4211645.1 hypothetical protein [Rhodothalassium salexigens DSM 2132]TCP34423.1 hypothetical protein EV659_10548 [Rhodothalassium salexigens DSM 2132]